VEIIKKNMQLDEADTDRLARLMRENKDVRLRVDMEILYREQMNHMIERDKLEIRCCRMPI